MIADEDKKTITVAADKVKSTDITHQEVRDGLYFELPRDMCELLVGRKKQQCVIVILLVVLLKRIVMYHDRHIISQ